MKRHFLIAFEAQLENRDFHKGNFEVVLVGRVGFETIKEIKQAICKELRQSSHLVIWQKIMILNIMPLENPE